MQLSRPNESENMPCMLLALDTFHAEMSWLKACVAKKICMKVVTCEVSQLAMGWLNANALEKVRSRFVTDDTSK